MGDLRKTPLGKLLLLQALIGGGSPAVERIALGNPLTFGTDLARPLVSLEIPFTPIQEGSGDPSPQNIRSILPWNGLKVFGGGKNLFDKATVTNEKYLNSAGEEVDNTGGGWNITDYMPVSGKVSYKGLTNVGNAPRSAWYDANKELISTFKQATGENTLTVPSGAKYVRFSVLNLGIVKDFDTFMFVIGEELGEYVPFAPITETDISFPSTIYGGYVDMVTGEVWRTWKGVDLGLQLWSKRSENQNRQVWEAYFSDAKFESDGSGYIAYALSSQFSLTTQSGVWSVGKFAPSTASNNKVFIFVVPAESYASASECKEGMTGIQLVYELAEPVLITTLTPQQINAIKGDNTIWSDADGSMTCVYLVSSKYADEHPVGGLGFGFGFGSGSSDPDEPDDPENSDEQEEPVVDDSENNQIEGEEP